MRVSTMVHLGLQRKMHVHMQVGIGHETVHLKVSTVVHPNASAVVHLMVSTVVHPNASAAVHLTRTCAGRDSS